MTKLAIVPPAEPPVVDLYVNWKAEIKARDWSAVHIVADRRQPLDLLDRPRRTWSK